MKMEWIMGTLWLLFVAYMGYRLYKKLNKRKNSEEIDINIDTYRERYYFPKKIMTPTELKFMQEIKKNIPDIYELYPQVGLSAIIKKVSNDYYANELYKVLDFVVVNKATQFPVLAIEINDETHNDHKRHERDNKVKAILEMAEIPLVTFWTSKGVNDWYIKQELDKYLRK